MAKLENLIAKQFDKLSDTFPSHIDRNDARLNAILNYCGDIKRKKILEVGCGKGRMARVLNDKGADIYGIDISEKLLQTAKKIKPHYFLEAEAYNIPFKDNTFNLVIMLEVIEHIPILLSALNEITRVLKNDGKLIIVDRNKFSFNNRRFLVPNLLVKRYHEIKNEWMYPNDFPYRERWFNPYAIHKILKEYFKDSEYEYVLSDGERQRWWHAIFRAIPQIRHFVLWHSTNKYSKNSG